MRDGVLALFVNMFGEHFRMEFDTGVEFECFVDKAAKIGTKLIAFVGLDFQDEEEEA